MLFPGDFHADPVIRGGGGLAPNRLGSVTERSPACGGVLAGTNLHQQGASAAVLEAMAHPFQKGGGFAHRSILVERLLEVRATNERPKDDMPGLIGPERFTCGTTFIWCSCVFLNGLG